MQRRAAGLITGPLRSRFDLAEKLDYYPSNDLEVIITRSARILAVAIDDEGRFEVARRSRGTPRIANRLLRRVRDFAQVRADGLIDGDVARRALEVFGVDALGLDKVDGAILDAIVNRFGGGPVGLSTLAVAVGEEPDTIEDVYEPFLMQIGFLRRTPREGWPPVKLSPISESCHPPGAPRCSVPSTTTSPAAAVGRAQPVRQGRVGILWRERRDRRGSRKVVMDTRRRRWVTLLSLTLCIAVVESVLVASSLAHSSCFEHPSSNPKVAELPNVLVIVTDDQRQGLGVMPRTRRVFGREGTDFKNAFVSDPLCCPSRASIFSGRYPHNTHVETEEEAKNLAQDSTIQRYLKQAGYCTGIFGKYLNSWKLSTPPPFFDVASIFTLSANAYRDTPWNVDGKVVTVPDYSTGYISRGAQSFLRRRQLFGRPEAVVPISGNRCSALPLHRREEVRPRGHPQVEGGRRNERAEPLGQAPVRAPQEEDQSAKRQAHPSPAVSNAAIGGRHGREDLPLVKAIP